MSLISLKKIVESKIRRSKKRVFHRQDFEKLSGYDQVGRALKTLVNEEKLIKVGYGLYAKARLNSITNEPMLDSPGGFTQIAKEALKRLKISYKPGSATQAYLRGSTQVPMKLEVQTRQRFSRKISYNDSILRVKKIR